MKIYGEPEGLEARQINMRHPEVVKNKTHMLGLGYVKKCVTRRFGFLSCRLLCSLVVSVLLAIALFSCLIPALAAPGNRTNAPERCQNPIKSSKTIMIVFGTRPEAIKMASVIKEVSQRPNFRSVIVSTGQHKEMLRQVLLDFNLQDFIHYELSLMSPGQTLSELSARALTSVTSVILKECPDVVLVQGDTTTAFMSALAAFYAKIPVGHIEAGLRTHDIYAPFPEEVNRQSISTMSTFHFAPTDLAAQNLHAEGRTKNVFVTGNTVVDALKFVQGQPLSDKAADLIRNAESRVPNSNRKIILLTAHRRENLGKPLTYIFQAVSSLLKKYEELLVIYPIHLNPAVETAVRETFGDDNFNTLKAGKEFSSDSNLEHLNRMMLTPPVHHADLVALLENCYLVMTDSGGIQEEAITLGKPVLVLRDTTERPEGVFEGVSKLVGTNTSIISQWAEKLINDDVTYKQMSNSRELFGDGNAAKKIVDRLENQFGLQGGMREKLRPVGADTLQQDGYDMVVVLTVWKRDTAEEMLRMIRQQSCLVAQKVAVVLFQNGDHVNISSIVDHWKQKSAWLEDTVDLLHIFSQFETGYYGRFLAPLSLATHPESTFIIMDDDIIFGSRYFENMLRVVQEGSLATRNGRFLDENLNERDWRGYFVEGPVDTYNEDDTYDFGGHIWAGKTEWLRIAWQHPPPLFHTAEDFWISVVLYKYLGISTKRPRCPSPREGGDIELCACSMKIANDHIAANVGASAIDEARQSRPEALVKIKEFFEYQTVLSRDSDAEKKVAASHEDIPLTDFLSLDPESSEKFAQCLFWY